MANLRKMIDAGLDVAAGGPGSGPKAPCPQCGRQHSDSEVHAPSTYLSRPYTKLERTHRSMMDELASHHATGDTSRAEMADLVRGNYPHIPEKHLQRWLDGVRPRRKY